MRGIALATFASLTFWGSLALAYALGQGSEFGARVAALIVAPCAVLAVLVARAPSDR